jgi:sulfur carrier protein ThiS
VSRPVLRSLCLRISLVLSVVLGLSAQASYAAARVALTSISLSPTSVTLPLAGTQQYTATGKYSNGTTANITSSVTWTSSNTAVVSISSSGLATALAGSKTAVTIKAKLGSITSSAASITPPLVLSSISLSPATATLALGATQQYEATGKYSNGTTANITSSVTWVSSVPTAVSISSSGLATVLAGNKAAVTIKASLENITSPAASITVPTAITSIAITPAKVSLAVGGSQQYTATATYTNGTTANITSSVTWKSSSPTAVGISSAGLATVLTSSTSAISITAAEGGITSPASTVTVSGALTAITITPASVALALNGTQQYVATGTYSNGTTATITSSVTWASSNSAVVSIGSTGLATDLASSATAVTISATSGSIKSNISTVTVASALTSIAITPASVILNVNGTQQYSAVGTYSNGTTANITSSVTWGSSSPATVSITSAGLATLLVSSSAATSITAAVGGIISNASAVSAATLTSIAVTPASISVGLGAQQQYAAVGTYSNGSTQTLTSGVTWTSANPSLVGITSAGLATVLGTSTTAIGITATSGTITSNIAYLSALSTLPVVCPSPTINMNLLVVSDGETEADFPAILQILNYVGVPYTVFDFNASPGGITPALLSDGNCHGYFQGVIFASGGYIYTLPGMSTLTSYEQTFGVRQVNWYTYPGTDFGFQASTGSIPSTSTYQGTYTSAGTAVFPYLNSATPLQIANASVYLAQPNTPPAGTSITPLIVDSSGNALSLIYNFGDGRQYLTQTFDSNAYLTHDLVLAYGLLNWVTQGVYLGEYHVYAAAQVDDFFINDSEWIPGTPCTDPITNDRTPPDSSTLPVFRLVAADMASLVAWQNKVESDPLLKTFKLTLAFNGVGTTGNNDWTGVATPGRAYDDLTMNVQSYQQYFHWITHTFDHPGTLDGLLKSSFAGDPDTPQVDDIDLEILTNQYVANGSGVNVDIDQSDDVVPIFLTDFNPANAVTPGVTGLNDPYVPTYMYEDGIRYVVSDTSVANTTNPPNNNGANPSPNVGIVNSYEPGIYEVPRHPNDVFYNAANWNDDDAEFLCLYNNPAVPPYNTFTGPQILDYVSSSFVTNMLIGDMDPEMFHQPDLHDYDGLGDSLISDTYNMTFVKYEALYNLPVLSLTLDQLALGMQARNAYNLSGVTASLVGAVGSQQVVLAMPAGATVTSASIPVTGLTSTGSETYGGVNISHIALTAGQSVTLPLQ